MSGDLPIGIPWNWACYSVLTHMLAAHAGLEVGEFAHTIVDCHIYKNQLESIEQQFNRRPYSLPKLEVPNKNFFEMKEEDIKLIDYKHHPFIKIPVSP